MRAIAEAGAEVHRVTLHVGAGTFLPVKAEDTDGHHMHSEWGRLDAATAEALNATRRRGGRIVAVGTTSLQAARKRGGAGRRCCGRSPPRPTFSSRRATASGRSMR